MQDFDEFTEALEIELRLRGFGFERWKLTDFVRGCWPCIDEDPSPGKWARAFIDASDDPACQRAGDAPPAVRIYHPE